MDNDGEIQAKLRWRMKDKTVIQDMASEVKDILALQDPNLVISKAFKLCITQGDLATPKEGCWLNDKVIDFYLPLLMK
ncbi:sentrin-specific protease 2-like isoform X2 [Tachysurus fulvidraco]|uniref:sentrin-specific protease 2-like isoform X2 n=1 Tax=Tachysurus fulvidraco TaxID=1234273 RepID=UPI001FF0513D|nr:sentrin-specific protease 2-like isoform X2 [Tachysurus fulvidraco]